MIAICKTIEKIKFSLIIYKKKCSSCLHLFFMSLLMHFSLVVLSVPALGHYPIMFIIIVVAWFGSLVIGCHACFTSFHTRTSLLTIPVSLYYLIIAIPMCECLEKTLVHEFPISYSHIEINWMVPSSFMKRDDLLGQRVACPEQTII